VYQAPLRPLPSNLSLAEPLQQASCNQAIGAWVAECCPGHRLYRVRGAVISVLVARDLGFLLARCDCIVLRHGQGVLVLPADLIIGWRALQVATASPCIPTSERLEVCFPGIRSSAGAMLVPLRHRSPEDVLARCLAEGIQVAGSRVVYPASG
jgi:hypothetical protein